MFRSRVSRMHCRYVPRAPGLCSGPVAPRAIIVWSTRQQYTRHTIPALCSNTWYLQRTLSRVPRFSRSRLTSKPGAVVCMQSVPVVLWVSGTTRGCMIDSSVIHSAQHVTSDDIPRIACGMVPLLVERSGALVCTVAPHLGFLWFVRNPPSSFFFFLVFRCW